MWYSSWTAVARIREALSELLESHGTRAIIYDSAGEYVRTDRPDLPASLILDVELPDTHSLDLQKQIADGDHPPIIFTPAQAAREQKAGKCVPGCQGEVRVCVHGIDVVSRRVFSGGNEIPKRSQMQIDH
jgi:CheY-like chemotaxis protein